jgi:hypothetical protein
MPQRISCPHPEARPSRRLCQHLSEDLGQASVARFTGVGHVYDLLCTACASRAERGSVPMVTICEACFAPFEEDQTEYLSEVVGTPEIRERPSSRAFRHEIVSLSIFGGSAPLDIQPASAVPSLWFALTRDGRVVSIDLAARKSAVIAEISELPAAKRDALAMRVSSDGGFAAIMDPYGTRGLVLDLAGHARTMELVRDQYHSGVTYFPIAFAIQDGRAVLVHGTGWNRLDISDPRTGALLTPRVLPTGLRKEGLPPHYQHLFWGRLSVSPSQGWIGSSAWAWQPQGVFQVWSLRRWLQENVWESEDGPSKGMIFWRESVWDDPVCWIDERTLAVWGFGSHYAPIPAVRIFDRATGSLLRWFPGPEVDHEARPRRETPRAALDPGPRLLFDEHLFAISSSHGVSVWDADTGERLLRDADCRPDRYHPATRQFLTLLGDGSLRLSWLA